jgi:hypothetical protein
VIKGKRRERSLSISGPFVWRTLRNKFVIGFGIYVQPPQPGVYPSVVDEQTFYAVQQRLETNKRQTTSRATTASSLFTGIAFCNKCGGTMCRYTQCRKSKKYHYLVCSDTVNKHGRCGMTGIRYDAVEKSFVRLLIETDYVRKTLCAQQPAVPSLLDSLAGQLADADRQIKKFMTLIESDPNPSPVVYKSIKAEEAKAANLRQQIEAEQGRLKAEAPAMALENYEDFRNRFSGNMEQAEYRQAVKALIPGFVLRIEVKLGENRYDVWLKGAKQAIEVFLVDGGCMFSPAPSWVLNLPVAEGANIIG